MIRLFCTLLLLATSFCALAFDASRARELIDADAANEAYELLAAEEWNHAGNPEFDYWLGVAALNSKRYTEATLAFERVLTVNPGHMGARLDMGLAFLALGDIDRAREAFETVEQTNPPPLVRQLITAQLDGMPEDSRLVRSAYVALTFGYDSNINNSTDQGSIYVPLFDADLLLDSTNVEQSDYFARTRVGGQLEYQLEDKRFVTGSVNAQKLMPADAAEFGTDGISAQLGYGGKTRTDRWELGLRAGQNWLDGDEHNRQAGIYGSMRLADNPRQVWDLYGQHTQVRYDGALSVDDFNQSLVGGRMLLAPAGTSTVNALGIFGGVEDATNGRADGDRDFAGISYSLQGRINDRLTAAGSSNVVFSRYSDSNLAFLEKREDNQFTARVGVDWQVSQDWLIAGEWSLTRNSSNIPVYDYERYVFGVTLRRDFK